MRKIIMLIMIAMSSCIAAAQEASGFKGFVDIYGGLGMGSGKGVWSTSLFSVNLSDLRPKATFGMNITEGYQINEMFFAGLGVGCYSTVLRTNENDVLRAVQDIQSVMVPIYVNGRWTLNIGRRVTPFVDLKIGYQMSVKINDGSTYYNTDSAIKWEEYYSMEKLFMRYPGCLYVQPSVGVRFGGAVGFNLGIAYNALMKQRFMVGHTLLEKDLREIQKTDFGSLMLTMGIDF